MEELGEWGCCVFRFRRNAADPDGIKAEPMRFLFDRVRARHDYFPWEQSNITPKRAEQCSEAHRPQVPVMRVFQSVSLS